VIKFEAHIDSNLPLSVEWLSDDKQLKPDLRTNIIEDDNNIYSLEISDASVDDSATISCVAENVIGKVIDNAILTVKGIIDFNSL
jgi:hypothetical protein